MFKQVFGILLFCSIAFAAETYYYGSTLYMGNGGFRVYLSVDQSTDIASRFGCEFSAAFFVDPPPGIEGEEVDYKVEIVLPDEAGVYTQFQSFESNWAPDGHPGTPYAAPHIDFHFYFQNKESRLNISAGECAGLTRESYCKAIAALPVGCCPPVYGNVGIPVPVMGNHLLDLMGPEMQPPGSPGAGPFTDTLIYGTYDSRITFFEPMVTIDAFKSVMATSSEVCRPIRLPGSFAVAGYYPTIYCYRYLATGNFRVEFRDFAHFSATCSTTPDPNCTLFPPSTPPTKDFIKNCSC